MLQNVAFGITKIKHDSGDGKKVVHGILATKFSQANVFYIKSCKIADFSPLSESSLGRFCMPLNLHKESHLQYLMI